MALFPKFKAISNFPTHTPCLVLQAAARTCLSATSIPDVLHWTSRVPTAVPRLMVSIWNAASVTFLSARLIQVALILTETAALRNRTYFLFYSRINESPCSSVSVNSFTHFLCRGAFLDCCLNDQSADGLTYESEEGVGTCAENEGCAGLGGDCCPTAGT